ncbi:hypothetical protein [Pseudomonas sp. TNT3]|uniref:hypothetical protein n=1 Tax=Pseudomonas sp. TNT3 TaxID=2654097 RepID=UPI00139091E4|nr:hypothetical protein [Pseudomonas sp. TNT3]KAI2693230.1 hypothetical protein GBC55_006770 [Pseudomonas sp. TNT3]
MEAKKFFRGAVNHLSRATDLFARAQSNTDCYFYCALELRFGIESRLREYLQYQSHVAQKKKNGWQIAALGRDVEQAFYGCTKEVRVEIWSDGFPMIRCKYTPVTPQLRAIGEQLGNYLHAPKTDDLREMEQWSDFESKLDLGLRLLTYSCSGILLGVPLVSPSAKKGVNKTANMNLSLSPDQNDLMKELYRQKKQIEFKVSYGDPVSS